jgi:hypothetical protein
LDKEVLQYLELSKVSPSLVADLRRELSDLSSEIPACALTKAWNYASDGYFEVAVSRMSGATDLFDVHQWTTVRDLKDMIEARMHIPVAEQLILKGGQELRGDRDNLSVYRVTMNSCSLQVLQVEARASPEKPGCMEIRLTYAEGIPEGSIISIRAGDSRKQAPLSFDTPFKFAGRREAANPFKIDVFAQLGKARLVLRPAEESYVAHLENSDGMRMAVLGFDAWDDTDRERRLKQQQAAAAAADKQSQSTNLRAQRSVLASRYFDKHGLYQYMQGLFQSLMTEKPDNPYQYMIKQLQAADEARALKQNSSDGQSTDGSTAVPAGNSIASGAPSGTDTVAPAASVAMSVAPTALVTSSDAAATAAPSDPPETSMKASDGVQEKDCEKSSEQAAGASGASHRSDPRDGDGSTT